jgi:S-DNA-T family DNA segregation ATPase FtsK/SpoIIIE
MHQVLIEEARSTFDRRLNERQERFDENRDRIAQSFRQQLILLQPSIAKFSSEAIANGPEWSAPVWRTWTPSNRMPRATCVGEMLAGIREDRLTLPALLPFPHERALIVKSDAHARDRALGAIQSILLRLVATVPPGDLRFILIDPLGQGQNVAAFMPFADLGIGLGEGRAWTEPQQIEQRLHDLVNLVEGANEAAAIHALLPRFDPSRATGIAEPCRVLVMLDFPTNVSGATARLLSTLVQKGPAHSIHPIVMVDTDKPSPFGLNVLELEQHATTLAWDGRRFVWNDADFRSCWIELDKPPSAQLARRILRGVHQPLTRTA